MESSVVGETPAKRHSAPAGLAPRGSWSGPGDGSLETRCQTAASPGATKDQPIPVPEATKHFDFWGTRSRMRRRRWAKSLKSRGRPRRWAYQDGLDGRGFDAADRR